MAASPQGSARYHSLIRPSEDISGEDSPVASLLPKPKYFRRQHRTYSCMIIPALVLRFLSNLAATAAFIIFVIDAVHVGRSWWKRQQSGDYIAAAVFLVVLMVHNFFMLVYRIVVITFGITIEFKHKEWSPIVPSRKKPKIGMMLDLGTAFCLALSLIIGNGVGRYHFNTARIVAVVFAYITVLLQLFVAVPALDEWTLTLKLESGSGEEEDALPADIKLPISSDEADEAARYGSPSMHGARPSDVDQQRISVEQLV